jgi:methyltransferase (TIGR00027 family)
MSISMSWKLTGRIGRRLIIALIALAVGVHSAFAVRPGEVSWTAEGVLALRAIGTLEPDEKIRNPDYLAEKFINPVFWHYSVYSPTDYATNMKVVRAYRADTYFLVNARTHKIDQTLKEMAADGLEQVVVLGAGFDTRAYRFAEKMPQVRFFELDLPATLQRKKEMVKAAIGHVPDYVAYAPIDFNTETIEEALVRVGYNPAQKTFFVWEGVTMYITEEAVRGTLTFIATRSAPGSVVVFDYMMAGVAAKDWKTYPQARISATLCALHGEPWIFGFPEPSAGPFVQKFGLDVVEDLDGKAMTEKYMTRSDGKRDGMAGSHWGLMHARVPRP